MQQSWWVEWCQTWPRCLEEGPDAAGEKLTHYRDGLFRTNADNLIVLRSTENRGFGAWPWAGCLFSVSQSLHSSNADNNTYVIGCWKCWRIKLGNPCEVLKNRAGSTLLMLDVSLLLLLFLQLEAVLCTVLGLCFKVCPAEVMGFWRGCRNWTVVEDTRDV